MLYVSILSFGTVHEHVIEGRIDIVISEIKWPIIGTVF